MKKTLVMLTALALALSVPMAGVSSAYAYGVGAKFAAMGGAGAALVDDSLSAYYNPAGIVESQGVSLKLGAGAATEGADKLIAALASMNDPSKFFTDNIANAVDINGSANAFIGLTFMKMGLSVYPNATLIMTKAAGATTGSVTGAGGYTGAFTMGYGVGVPLLGSLNIGANLKTATSVFSTGTIAVGAVTNNVTTLSGVGLDLGAKGNIDAIPMMPLKAALVIKNIGLTMSGKTENTVTPTGGSSTTTVTDATPLVSPTTVVVAAAGQIPVVGATLALDIENTSGGSMGSTSFSTTHIGVEYPVLAGLIALRAGKATGGVGGSVDVTTIGAGVLGLLNVAMVTDNKNTKNNQTMFDFGIGF